MSIRDRMYFLKLIDKCFNKSVEKQFYGWLIFLTGVVWVVVFRDFVFDKLAFTSDAISYYDHTKFFVESLMRGEFPLWDPNWNAGIPNGLFLRRLGCFNPAYLMIILLKLTGLSFRFSYLFFLVIYFFIGMFGFYCLTKEVYKDRLFAFIGFLLLSFSALGSRLFDSYLHLEFVPLVWFFYFLLSFLKKPRKFSLLGITLALMILFSTYIPFYFVTLMVLFILCGGLIFANKMPFILSQSIRFFRLNKILTGICLLAIIISLIPGIQFFLEMKQGDVVFPGRNNQSLGSVLQTDNSLEVGVETVSQWGLEEDLAFSAVYSDLRQYKFALMYVPGIVFLVLGIGIFAKLDRQLAMILIWAASIFLVVTPYGSIYPFLQKHVFYFKYFRNLHFFLWWILLPLFVLFVVGVLKSLWEMSKNEKYNKMIWLFLSGVVHVIFLICLWQQSFVLFSTYWMVVISFIMWSYIFSDSNRSSRIVVLLFMMAVLPQFMRVFGYLSNNYEVKSGQYQYDIPYQEFTFERNKFKELESFSGKDRNIGGALHVAIKQYSELNNKVDRRVFNHYLHHRFVIYDSVRKSTIENFSANSVENVFLGKVPAALVENIELEDLKYNNGLGVEWIEDDGLIEIKNFTTNKIQFKTKFDVPKFVIYNDGYYKGWSAKIDGERQKIRRSNINFKGLWVPSGDHEVELKFGSWFDYMMVVVLFVSFYGIFGWCLLECKKEKVGFAKH